MKRRTLREVAALAGGDLLRGDEATEVREIVTDSRRPVAEGGLFVALRGRNFDGHEYLEDAARAGAKAGLVERSFAANAPFDSVIAVDDTLVALQSLAAGWRSEFDGVVVGITGSNGKTIVKEMLMSMVGRERTAYRSPGSFNSQVGVPLSVLGIEGEHDVAIIEAGISEVGEMERLRPIVDPDIGIITMIGEAHAAGLGTLEVTAREKLHLFDALDGPLIYGADDPVLQKALDRFAGELVGFGASEAADYRIHEVETTLGGSSFEVEFPDGVRHRFTLSVPGPHNVWNAAAAIACADRLGVSVEAMRAGLRSYELAPMRLEMHTTGAGVTLLNDAYSSDPVSAAAALNVLHHYAAGQRTIAILGDMLDLGASGDSAHRELGRLVARVGVDQLITVGPLAAAIGEAAVHDGFDVAHVHNVTHQSEVDAILERLVEPGDFVLFKGSRAVGLEHAAETLLESVAPARLIVDLSAIRENVQAIRRKIGRDAAVMAVVKSFGYGNDANRVALTLVNAGVDAFCVAYPDEGIPLRRRGIDLPILVTNVRAAEVDKIVKYGLAPLVFESKTVALIDHEAARRGTTVGVHVEVDTGMNRLGLEPEDAVALCREIREADNLRLDGVMTHFAAADDPAEDDFTRAQISAFRQVLADLDAEGLRPPIVHAANTAAAWRYPESKFDMVRIGLGLYGVHPSPDVGDETRGVQPALEFVTEVIFVKDVEAGESVGYGRTWLAPERRRIATIAAGYNDGFPRFMSNGGEVLIDGRRCPVVGTVCMDVSMVDVTDVPGVQVGDEVVLFGTRGGETVSIEEIATRGGTINYEILTNISPRVRRIFRR